ncbi:MAG: SOS response-associated peptidase [Chthonomonas sp.]|nr:SOS response-associated peptidase [Chthonomonas sp.]
MCARYALFGFQQSLLGLFEADEEWLGSLADNYNVTPTTVVPVGILEDGHLKLVPMDWGIVPYWAKDFKSHRPKPVNAKSETAAALPTFKGCVDRRRCVIPLSGFFEWSEEENQDKPYKQPHYITRKDGQLMIAAGLFDTWHRGKEDERTSATILTTEPNEFMARHHDRMPCFIAPEDIRAFCSKDVPWEAARTMCKPLDGDQLDSWWVTPRMNSVHYLERDTTIPVQSA